MNMMMNIYRDLLPSLGGYLTDKNRIHRARLELFVQELARREPLYFEHRAIEDQTSEYAGPQYRDFYYEVFVLHAVALLVLALAFKIPVPFLLVFYVSPSSGSSPAMRRASAR